MDTQKRIGKIVHIGQLLPEQLREPVSYDDVELTDEELNAAILEAKKKKAIRLEDERRKLLAAQMREDLLRPWTPNQLWNHAKSRGDRIVQFETGKASATFEHHEFQKPIIVALSLYFSGASEFEDLDTSLYNTTGIPFSLNKGLWLWGNPGVGKTILMEMFRVNKRLCFDVTQCPKICYNYVKYGDDMINYLKHVVQTPAFSENYQQKIKGICYNDLGTEPLQSKHYGNPINVMETIFLETYENKVPWWHRHVTTNLTFEQVEQSYGVRVKDRIRQCFNVIEIKGHSLRK